MSSETVDFIIYAIVLLGHLNYSFVLFYPFFQPPPRTTQQADLVSRSVSVPPFSIERILITSVGVGCYERE